MLYVYLTAIPKPYIRFYLFIKVYGKINIFKLKLTYARTIFVCMDMSWVNFFFVHLSLEFCKCGFF